MFLKWTSSRSPARARSSGPGIRSWLLVPAATLRIGWRQCGRVAAVDDRREDGLRRAERHAVDRVALVGRHVPRGAGTAATQNSRIAGRRSGGGDRSRRPRDSHEGHYRGRPSHWTTTVPVHERVDQAVEVVRAWCRERHRVRRRQRRRLVDVEERRCSRTRCRAASGSGPPDRPAADRSGRRPATGTPGRRRSGSPGRRGSSSARSRGCRGRTSPCGPRRSWPTSRT